MNVLKQRQTIKFNYAPRLQYLFKKQFKSMENNPIVNYSSLIQKSHTLFLKMKFMFFLVFVGFLFLSIPANGQNSKASPSTTKNESPSQSKRKLIGKVVDKKGETIIGATVKVKNTSTGTITNMDGEFMVEVPSDTKILTITYVGYAPKEVVLGSQNSYKIVLEDSGVNLAELVVVGYGAQKKESVVGAISQVGSDDLVRSGTTNITNAIAGKLSGVLTMQQSGQPGQNNSEIVIRGLSSWNGSQPLVLVDGVERDFTNLDPNEVNTVSVLKDASATAVFGAKGANGVIIVTTKRGTIGKAKLNVSASTGMEVPTSLPEHISSYTTMNMLNVAYKNVMMYSSLIPQSSLNQYKNPSSPLNSLQYPDNNWFDMMTNAYAPTDQANINLSGGTKFVKYFASFGYTHQGDFFKGYSEGFDDTRYKNDRINYRSNLDFEITPSTSLSLNLGGDVQIVNAPQNSPWKSLYGASPAAYPAYFPAWVLQQVPDPDYPNASGVRYADKIGEYFDNPYNLFYNGSFNKKLTSILFTDLMLNQKLDFITQGLSFKAKVSLSTSFTNNALSATYAFPQYRLDYSKIGVPGANPWFRVGQGNEVYTQAPLKITIGDMTNDYYTNLYSEFSTQYNRTFGKHTVTGLALINLQQKNLATDKDGVQFPYLNAGIVGRVTYDYASKYLLEMNLGYTGSERFAPGNRFGLFPSVAVGWIASEEPFFKAAFPSIDKLKFRYSDGLVGSDNASNRWLYISNYTASGNYITEDAAANSVAQWEMAHKRDLGIEVGLFKNQLRFSVDLYDEFRDNMLLTPNTVTFLVGNSFKDLNLGSMKKHGIEVEVEFNKKVTANFNYFVKGNFGFNENRIVNKDDLPYSEAYQKLAGTALGGQLSGLNLNGNQFFTSVNDLHINPNPVAITAANVGDYQYVDYNADGKINSADLHPIEGSQYPSVTYSFSSGFSYKGFDFKFMFQGNANKYINYNGAFEYEFLKGNLRVHTAQLDYWSPTNLTANHSTLNYQASNDPKYGWAGGAADATNGYGGMLAGRTWQNADYLRLKEVYMGYNFKSKVILKLLGIENLTVYATGNNLLTFTKLLEGDPESTNFMDGFYPQMISGNVGFKVSF